MFIKSVYNKSPYKDRLDEITLEEINLIKNTCNQLSTSKKYVTHSEFCNAIREELTNLNKKTRKFQMSDNLEISNAHPTSNFSTKLLKNSFLKLFSEQKELTALQSSSRAHKNLDKKMKQNIEIDKMEVFSLIKQYAGVNGYIMLHRMVLILDMLKFCKKFYLVKSSGKIKIWKLVNYAQIVDIVAVEKAVLGILASNLKSLEQHEIVVNNIATAEKQEFTFRDRRDREESKVVRASKSFMNDVLRVSLSLKKKATELDNEDRRLGAIDGGNQQNGEDELNKANTLVNLPLANKD